LRVGNRRKIVREQRVRIIRNFSVVFIIILFLVFIGLPLLKKINFSKSGTIPKMEYPPTEALHLKLQDIIKNHGISVNRISTGSDGIESWRIEVPQDLPIPSLHLAIKEGISPIDAGVIYASSDPVSGRVKLQIGWDDSCFLCLNLIPLENLRWEEGWIALIIDDFGDTWNDFTKSFLNLGANLTFSIIPGMKLSAKIAREISGNGFETILHLPMEPLQASYAKNKFTILTGMGRNRIGTILQRAIDSVPGVSGMNNHMGSRVTSSRQTISMVLQELKKKNLYFVDSRTVASTVAYDIAREFSIPCGKRDVFIDTEMDKNVIRSRLWELAQKAETNGSAIGIGHCRRLTLEVLQEEIPRIQAKGYRFVFVSRIVR